MTATADTELAFAGPGALAAMVRAGEVAPRELVELYLRRIEALDPTLNAFRVVRGEQALAEAEQIDRSGPLAGVPIAVKDDLRARRRNAPPAARAASAPRRPPTPSRSAACARPAPSRSASPTCPS